MVTRFVDSSILLVAVGSADPRRASCQDFLRRSATAGVVLHADVDILQEFLFHRMRRMGRETAVRDARALRSTLVLHPFDTDALDLAITLVDTTRLRGRDAVHVAIARRAGFTEIVSLDRDFDDVPGLQRLDPVDA